MNSKHHKIRVGISVGDFNGVGPEVILKSLKNKNITDFFTPIIFGSGKLLSYQKNIFKLQTNFNYIGHPKEFSNGKINVVNLWKDAVSVELGKPTDESTRMAVESLQAGVESLKNREIDILVTAPINKDEMMKHGFKYAGHTEYLEEQLGGKSLMFLVTEDLKVAVATHHIPLEKVSQSLTKEKIKEQLKLLNKTLIEDFCVQKPKIAVLGLNPHAGDGGVIGDEEIKIIIPAIKESFEEGIMTFGPYPADSFFQPLNYRKFDAVLAMYHDQGLIPFKTLCYEDGVNYTAGLPFVRTSPDHGTAYDIAGKNLANEQSFLEAIFTGIKIFKNRKEYQELISHQLISREEKQQKEEG